METILDKLHKMDIPNMYATEESQPTREDKVIVAKITLPNTNWQWLIIEVDNKKEYSQNGQLAFGYVVSGLDPNFNELGYLDIEDIQSLTVKIPIKDIHTKEVLKELEQGVLLDTDFKPMKLVDYLKQEGLQ